jgi:hypothetical protein
MKIHWKQTTEKGHSMIVDAIKRTITLTTSEARNHQMYLKMKSYTERGYKPVIVKPSASKPLNVLTVKRADLHNLQDYERAKLRATAQNKVLWLED